MVFQVRRNVPSRDGVRSPRVSANRLDVCQRLSAWRSHWRGIEQVHAFERLKRREPRILSADAHHVECVITVGGNFTAICQRE